MSTNDQNEELTSGTFPVLPLKNNVLFPEMMMPLLVGRESSLALVVFKESSQ